MVTNNYLFVYGTLLDSENEFAIFMRSNCTFIKKGRIIGWLYDFGEYPGAVLSENGKTYIDGSIYLMNNTPIVLEKLDDYEGYGPDQEQPNLFTRQLAKAETNGPPMDCWVYLYNRNVEGLKAANEG